MSIPSKSEMLAAVAARDSAFDGRFYYGVITTGVFCRPSCSSRQAKTENLRFFPDREGAMTAGFRPCKRCRPTGDGAQMDRLVRVARHIEAHADTRLTLEMLAPIAGLSSSRLQRVFKQSFGISPKDYQDAVRMRRFRQSLKQAERVTDAIYDSGFGSISRVYGDLSRNIGMTPGAYRAGGAGESISYVCRNTTLGPMLIAATDKGVCSVQFGDNENNLIAGLAQEFPEAMLTASARHAHPELDAWVEALNQHIDQGAPRPDLPLDMRGTAFQMKVWQFLLSIREGDVLSYRELAAGIGKPTAVRAAATACAKNRIGILVPCHRVIRGDGGLGGYRWGLARKRALLDAERTRQEPRGRKAPGRSDTRKPKKR